MQNFITCPQCKAVRPVDTGARGFQPTAHFICSECLTIMQLDGDLKPHICTNEHLDQLPFHSKLFIMEVKCSLIKMREALRKSSVTN